MIRSTFDALNKIKEDIDMLSKNDIHILLIGHHIQIDRSKEREVTSEEAIRFGKTLNYSWSYFEVDSKANDNEEGNIKWPFHRFLAGIDSSHKYNSHEAVKA